MNASPPPFAALDALLNRMRRRWRLRHFLEILALSLGIVLVGVLLLIVAMDAAQFDAARVGLARRSIWLLLLVAGLIAVGLFFSIQHSRRELVRRIERENPELDALVTTGFDRIDAEKSSPIASSEALEARLSSNAADALSRSNIVRGLDGGRIGRAIIASGIALLIFTALIKFGPDYLRHGAQLLAEPTADPEVGNPYALNTTPGNVSILEGEDLALRAQTEGFKPSQVTVYTRREGETEWRPQPMSTMPNKDGSYEFVVFDVHEEQDYYVEADAMASDIYHVDVIARPEIEQLDVVYQYPESTGRPEDRIENANDLKAIKGTRAAFEITPRALTKNNDTKPKETQSGRLVLDDGSTIPLKSEDGVLRGELPIKKDGRYHVEIEAEDGQMVAVSPEYAIIATEDELPVVRLSAPGRDSRATSVEEVSFAVTADDDVALNGVELVFSVNGGDDEVVALDTDSDDDTTRLSKTHRLYLEERALGPGDLVAYYARARDNIDDDTRQAVTDMYFIDIRPFEQNFRATSGGGGGGGGGGQSEDALAAQQRTLVVALFKLVRDQKTLDTEQQTERTQTLIEAENRIRDRVDAIIRRLEARRIVDMSPAFQRMAEELPKASAAMIDVTEALSNEEIDVALKEANEALLHLQRADAAVRDVTVSQSQSGQSGSATSDLSNLFRLEMDKFENKYADVQRNSQQNTEAELDETMRKLEELARRQQQEIERAARRENQSSDGDAGNSSSQSELAKAVEELIRKLRRLTRKPPQQSDNRSNEESRADASNSDEKSGEQGQQSQQGQSQQGQSQQGQSQQGQSQQGQSQQGQSQQGQSQQGQSQQGQSQQGQSQQGQSQQGQSQQGQSQQGQSQQGQSQQGQSQQGQSQQGQSQGGDADDEQSRQARAGESASGQEAGGQEGSQEQTSEQQSNEGGSENGEDDDESGTGSVAADESDDENLTPEERRRRQDITQTMRQLESAVQEMRQSANQSDPRAAERALDILREARRLLNPEQGNTQQETAAQLRDVLRGMRATRQNVTRGGGSGERQAPQTSPDQRKSSDIRDLVGGALNNQADQLQNIFDVYNDGVDQSGSAQDIGKLVEELRAMEETGQTLDDDFAARYEDLIERLKQIEFGVRSEEKGNVATDTIVTTRRQPRAAEDDEDLVDRYYRKLSENPTISK